MADERVSNGPVRLAVDFGTSHTVAVVRRDGQPARALLFDGSPLLPSGVYAGPGGDLHTGRDAERLAQVDPGGFEPHPKRTVDDDVVLIGRHEFPPAMLVGAVLNRVARAAAEVGLGPGDLAVLTCPADWGRRRRGVLLEAAERAGIRVAALVDEPVAAGTYCLDILNVAVGQSLVVFDFGGGTLDVAAIRHEPDGLRVLATGGLDNLGGLDVDSALVGQLGPQVAAQDPALWRRLDQPSDAAAMRDRRGFWAEVRGAKEMLSRTTAAPVPLPGQAGALHLTREELDRVAGPLVDRAVDETRRLLRDARIGPDELAGIFLVGGASRMPLVASKLHGRFGVAPAVPEQPELPVALGALPAADVPPPPAVSPAPDDWPATTVDIGSAPRAHAGTHAAKSRRGPVVAAVLAVVVVLLVAGLLWWGGGGKRANGTADSGSTRGPSLPAGAAPASSGPTVPNGFVPCEGSRLCPTRPTCWSALLIATGKGSANVFDCGRSHSFETYVAGYLPLEAVDLNWDDVQKFPAIKQLCDPAVLKSRLLNASITGTWKWNALPVEVGVNRERVVHCIAHPNGQSLPNAPVFRTGA